MAVPQSFLTWFDMSNVDDEDEDDDGVGWTVGRSAME